MCKPSSNHRRLASDRCRHGPGKAPEDVNLDPTTGILRRYRAGFATVARQVGATVAAERFSFELPRSLPEPPDLSTADQRSRDCAVYRGQADPEDCCFRSWTATEVVPLSQPPVLFLAICGILPHFIANDHMLGWVNASCRITRSMRHSQTGRYEDGSAARGPPSFATSSVLS